MDASLPPPSSMSWDASLPAPSDAALCDGNLLEFQVFSVNGENRAISFGQGHLTLTAVRLPATPDAPAATDPVRDAAAQALAAPGEPPPLPALWSLLRKPKDAGRPSVQTQVPEAPEPATCPGGAPAAGSSAPAAGAISDADVGAPRRAPSEASPVTSTPTPAPNTDGPARRRDVVALPPGPAAFSREVGKASGVRAYRRSQSEEVPVASAGGAAIAPGWIPTGVVSVSSVARAGSLRASAVLSKAGPTAAALGLTTGDMRLAAPGARPLPNAPAGRAAAPDPGTSRLPGDDFLASPSPSDADDNPLPWLVAGPPAATAVTTAFASRPPAQTGGAAEWNNLGFDRQAPSLGVRPAEGGSAFPRTSPAAAVGEALQAFPPTASPGPLAVAGRASGEAHRRVLETLPPMSRPSAVAPTEAMAPTLASAPTPARPVSAAVPASARISGAATTSSVRSLNSSGAAATGASRMPAGEPPGAPRAPEPPADVPSESRSVAPSVAIPARAPSSGTPAAGPQGPTPSTSTDLATWIGDLWINPQHRDVPSASVSLQGKIAGLEGTSLQVQVSDGLITLVCSSNRPRELRWLEEHSGALSASLEGRVSRRVVIEIRDDGHTMSGEHGESDAGAHDESA